MSINWIGLIRANLSRLPKVNSPQSYMPNEDPRLGSELRIGKLKADLRYLLMVVFVGSTQLLFSQTVPGSSISVPPTSDPDALAIVERALINLGGAQLWRQVGAVTAQATVSRSGSSPYTINWSDDWSTGRVRFRRDRVLSSNHTLSLVGSGVTQARVPPAGNITRVLHDNGIVVLAIGNPGAALSISLSPQYSCTFNLGQVAGPRFALGEMPLGASLITEFCADPFYPDGKAPLVWEFSKTDGTPLAVELPVWGMVSHSLRVQTVMFTAFQSINGLITPSQITVRRVSGAVDQMTISNTTFGTGLPDTLFQSRK